MKTISEGNNVIVITQRTLAKRSLLTVQYDRAAYYCHALMCMSVFIIWYIYLLQTLWRRQVLACWCSFSLWETKLHNLMYVSGTNKEKLAEMMKRFVNCSRDFAININQLTTEIMPVISLINNLVWWTNFCIWFHWYLIVQSVL